MKTLLMLICFGSFLFTGNWMAAVAVICLGSISDAPTTNVPGKPFERLAKGYVTAEAAVDARRQREWTNNHQGSLEGFEECWGYQPGRVA